MKDLFSLPLRIQEIGWLLDVVTFKITNVSAVQERDSRMEGSICHTFKTR